MERLRRQGNNRRMKADDLSCRAAADMRETGNAGDSPGLESEGKKREKKSQGKHNGEIRIERISRREK